MYEINLVPDVKAELLNKQKLRNLVILICIVAGIACVVIVLSLVGVVGTQAISLSEQDKDIKCRSTGEGSCQNKGTAVNKYNNLEALLTMKSQMYDIDVLNYAKVSPSRVLPMFDVILPDNSSGQGTVNISMADIDFNSMSFTINANSSNSVGFTARESFTKALKLTYYDYGRYIRSNGDTEEEIPTFCITEVEKNGYLYGVYHKGMAGCESPIITKANKDGVIEPANNDVEDIYIRRTYKNQQDFDDYKRGNDTLKESKKSGYYFQSECIQYDSDGNIDQESTVGTCGLLDGDVVLQGGSYGKGDNGGMLLTFTAQFVVAREAFLTVNRHMNFVGPSRQNVTDSYVPVRDIFTEEKVVTEEVKTDGK